MLREKNPPIPSTAKHFKTFCKLVPEVHLQNFALQAYCKTFLIKPHRYFYGYCNQVSLKSQQKRWAGVILVISDKRSKCIRYVTNVYNLKRRAKMRLKIKQHHHAFSFSISHSVADNTRRTVFFSSCPRAHRTVLPAMRVLGRGGSEGNEAHRRNICQQLIPMQLPGKAGPFLSSRRGVSHRKQRSVRGLTIFSNPLSVASFVLLKY